MSDASLPGAVPVPKTSSLLVQDARTAKRNAAEARFKMYGLAAVITGILALVLLLASILSNGLSAFQQTYVTLEIALPEDKLDKSGTRDLEVMRKVSTFGYAPLIATAMEAKLAEAGIEIEGLTAKDAGAIISKDAPAQLRDFVLANPQVVGTTQTFELLANGRIDGYLKGRVSMESASLDKNVSPAQLQLTDALLEEGALEKRFNWGFFTNPDASGQRPEAAGLGVAIMGSLYMMMIVLCLALPIGVAASIDRKSVV